MTIGLLICDHIDEEYQDRFTNYPDMFQNLFPNFHFKLFDIINDEFPSDLNECDAYMSTGSRHSAYDDIPWIQNLKVLVKELYIQKKIFIGLCFGHQILATALSGEVKKSTQGWCIGVHSFENYLTEEWQFPAKDPINLLMMCQDQVTILPKGAKLIAGNKFCPIGIFTVSDHMLGIQAHPEFTKEYDRFLIEKRINRIGESRVREGITSLELPIHRETIREWIINFINQANGGGKQ